MKRNTPWPEITPLPPVCVWITHSPVSGDVCMIQHETHLWCVPNSTWGTPVSWRLGWHMCGVGMVRCWVILWEPNHSPAAAQDWAFHFESCRKKNPLRVCYHLHLPSPEVRAFRTPQLSWDISFVFFPWVYKASEQKLCVSFSKFGVDYKTHLNTESCHCEAYGVTTLIPISGKGMRKKGMYSTSKQMGRYGVCESACVHACAHVCVRVHVFHIEAQHRGKQYGQRSSASSRCIVMTKYPSLGTL